MSPYRTPWEALPRRVSTWRLVRAMLVDKYAWCALVLGTQAAHMVVWALAFDAGVWESVAAGVLSATAYRWLDGYRALRRQLELREGEEP